MKPRLLFVSAFLALTAFSFGQDSTKTYKHWPFGVTFTAGLAQTDFSNLNKSDTLLASVNSLHSNFGTGFFIGKREKFFGSVNATFRHYTNPTAYTYTINSMEQTTKVSSDIRHINWDVLLYKPILAKKKTTIFAFSGVTFAQTNMKIYKKDSQSITGLSSQTDYIARQNWNLNLGFMFDFLKTEALSNYISAGFKVGYSIPLTKTQWYLNDSKVNNAPTVNMGGLYGSLVWNFF